MDPKKGYQIAKKGSNGFHALVMRAIPEALVADWDFTHYPDNVYAPVGFDNAGVDSHMVVLFDLEKMRATGVSPQEAERLVTTRYKDGTYKAPSRTGLAYMLSPVLSHYGDGVNGIIQAVFLATLPHYMIYAPNVTNADIGGKPGYMTVIHPGIHGFIIHGSSPAEVKRIVKQNEQLIADLCAYKQSLCLSTGAN